MSPDHGPIRVVLVTDKFSLGDGLASFWPTSRTSRSWAGPRSRGAGGNGRRAPARSRIISIRTPVVTTMTTIEAARKLRVNYPELGIVVISDRGEWLRTRAAPRWGVPDRLPAR